MDRMGFCERIYYIHVLLIDMMAIRLILLR